MNLIDRMRPWLLLAAVLTVAFIGFASSGLLARCPWEAPGPARLGWIALVWSALAAASLAFAPRRATLHASVALLLVALALLGPGPLSAVAYLLLSSAALGDLVVRYLLRDDAHRDVTAWTLRALIGLALYATVLALTLPLRVHYLASWATLLAVPLALNWSAAGALCTALRADADDENRHRAHAAAFWLLGFALLLHLVLIPKPEAGADGLAMHLALPVKLGLLHHFPYDPTVYRWIMMPLTGTLSFAIAYLLGGEMAARLLDFAMLVVVVTLVVTLIRRWAPAWAAWLATAVFVSTPLVQTVTAQLMVENFQVAFLLGALVAVWQAWTRRGTAQATSFAVIAALLAGAAVQTKFGSLVLCVPLLYYALRCVTLAKRWLLIVAFLLFALPPYVNSFVRTGNPVFPYMGKVFPTQLVNASNEVRDLRWTERPNWRTLYDLTFHSTKFSEGRDGSFGFQVLLLAPLALGIAYRRWSGAPRAALWATLIGAPLMLFAVPHLRYLYPLVALSTLLLAVPWAYGETWWRRVTVVLALAVFALNIRYLPAGNWSHATFALHPLEPAETRQYLEHIAPERLVGARLAVEAPAAPVLVLDCADNPTAAFEGRVYSKGWHDAESSALNAALTTPESILEFASRRGVRWFVGCRADVPGTDSASARQRFLDNYTQPVAVAGALRLTRLAPQFAFRESLLQNGDFREGLRHWQLWACPQPVRQLSAGEGVEVSVNACAIQRIPLSGGATFRLSEEVRCPAPGAAGRLQINWMDGRGRALPVTIVPLACTNEWKSFTSDFTAPPEAASGYVYVTGHTSVRLQVRWVKLEG